MTGPFENASDAALRAAPLAADCNVMFGKRLQPQEREISYFRERSRISGAELNLPLAYRIEAQIALAHLRENCKPELVIGKAIGPALTVQIERLSSVIDKTEPSDDVSLYLPLGFHLELRCGELGGSDESAT